MKYYTALISALTLIAGCTERTIVPTPVPAGAEAKNFEAQPKLIEEAPKPDVPVPSIGTVARVDIEDQDRETDLNRRLLFCVFENGEYDTIFVGTNYGMWSRGKFDLEIDGKLVFTGHVNRLLYEGVVIDMGDVIDKQPDSSINIYITRVSGMFK